MDKIILDENLYSAFLEGKAKHAEVRAVMEEMLCDSQLILKLNLAATDLE
jgi:hypothetical protein